MDTSETYIRMCEKAEEIQEDARINGIEYGDYICWDTGWVEVIRGEKGYKYAPLGVVFIPRQDQLQEMVGGYKEGDENNLLYDFCEWIDTFKHFTSMEQLWLAFVMKKKWDKIWNGNEWVKAS